MHRIALVLLAASSWLPAAQTVLLKNGGRIEAESISREGDTVFLHTKRLIWVLERGEIAAIEDPDAPAPPKSALPPPPPAAGAPVRRLIDDAARRHGLPASLIHAVAAVESGYSQAARSGPGAIGVMQLMPATARSLGADPHDTEQNIDAGVRFLRYLLLKYQSDPNQLALALAAYNAGPSAVDRFGGVPPYAETQRYVDKVINRYQTGESAPKR